MSKTAVISKWGNAQGLRIPKAFCHQLGISVGDRVSLSIEEDRLVISGANEEYTLKARMKNWNGVRNQAHEYDWGKPVGKETW
jgi:antitoxin MazE